MISTYYIFTTKRIYYALVKKDACNGSHLLFFREEFFSLLFLMSSSIRFESELQMCLRCYLCSMTV